MTSTKRIDPAATPEGESGMVIDMPVRARKAQPAKATVDFVREHPALVVAGSIAAGILVAALLPKRRARKAGKRVGVLAEAFGGAVMTLGKQMLERAETTGADLRRRGDSAAHQAEDLGSVAAKRVGALLGGWLDSAEHLGSAAASRAGKAGEVAGDVANKAGKRLGKAAADARSRIIG